MFKAVHLYLDESERCVTAYKESYLAYDDLVGVRRPHTGDILTIPVQSRHTESGHSERTRDMQEGMRVHGVQAIARRPRRCAPEAIAHAGRAHWSPMRLSERVGGALKAAPQAAIEAPGSPRERE